MDRYHLSWLMVGRPAGAVRGRPMDSRRGGGLRPRRRRAEDRRAPDEPDGRRAGDAVRGRDRRLTGPERSSAARTERRSRPTQASPTNSTRPASRPGPAAASSQSRNGVAASRSGNVRDEPGRMAIATSHAPTRPATQHDRPQARRRRRPARADGRWAWPPHAPSTDGSPDGPATATAATAMMPVVRSRIAAQQGTQRPRPAARDQPSADGPGHARALHDGHRRRPFDTGRRGVAPGVGGRTSPGRVTRAL